MHVSKLKKLLWDGQLELAPAFDSSPMAGLLRAVVPLQRTHVILKNSHVEPFLGVYFDTDEVEKDISVGDIMCEELGVYMPKESVLVVMTSDVASAATTSEASYWAGYAAGQILNAFIHRGLFLAEEETTAVYLMSKSYHEIASSAFLSHIGLKRMEFRTGLSRAFVSHVIGENCFSEEAQQISGADYIYHQNLVPCLKTMDPLFFVPEISGSIKDVMACDSWCGSGDVWVRRVVSRVSEIIGFEHAESQRINRCFPAPRQ